MEPTLRNSRAAAASRFAALTLGALLTLSLCFAQKPKSQSDLALKAPFEVVHIPAGALKKLIEAHDLKSALKMTGKSGAFYGTVTSVIGMGGNRILALDFDKNYKIAATAVLFSNHFADLPDMRQLQGKKIIVSGTWSAYKGAPQIEIQNIKQIKIIAGK